MLIKSAQEGGKEAFGQLYEKYAQKIYAFLLHKTFHAPTAEDLTSETFFKALRNLPAFNPEKASFSTWLFSIARHNVIDHFRKDRPAASIEDIWDLASSEDVPEHVSSLLKSELLKNCMSTMNAEQREILTLRFWQDMSYAQIAQVLGKTEGSVKTAASRSIKKLREAHPELLTLLILLRFANI